MTIWLDSAEYICKKLKIRLTQHLSRFKTKFISLTLITSVLRLWMVLLLEMEELLDVLDCFVKKILIW